MNRNHLLNHGLSTPSHRNSPFLPSFVENQIKLCKNWTPSKINYQSCIMNSFMVRNTVSPTVWKMSKYGFFSGPYFSLFGVNTRKYGLENTPYLDSFHAVSAAVNTHVKVRTSFWNTQNNTLSSFTYEQGFPSIY